MFKIGDFSKLSRVPVTALRYYDEVGLLKPVRVDGWTGYRYYSANQLPQAEQDTGPQGPRLLARGDRPLAG